MHVNQILVKCCKQVSVPLDNRGLRLQILPAVSIELSLESLENELKFRLSVQNPHNSIQKAFVNLEQLLLLNSLVLHKSEQQGNYVWHLLLVENLQKLRGLLAQTRLVELWDAAYTQLFRWLVDW